MATLLFRTIRSDSLTPMDLFENAAASVMFSARIFEGHRGSIPGDGYSNVRRPLLHTLNLADMLPVTSVWAGLRENHRESSQAR
jgi:hypothetical protein